VSPWEAFSADGYVASWETWDGEHIETLTLRWENEAWTATGRLGRDRVEYVLRVSPTWRVRQFLLFRDLDEPDLWLGTDGHNRWGEVNGAHRTELDGCDDVEVPGSAFAPTVSLRRLPPLEVGDSAEVAVVTVDVETLAATPATRRYTRLDERRWRRWRSEDGAVDEFDVDSHGLPLDQPERFRRCGTGSAGGPAPA
jgi:hypothetical protein